MVTAEQLKSSMNNYIRQNITAKDTTTSQQLGIYKNVYGLPSNITQTLAKLQELQRTKEKIESWEDPLLTTKYYAEKPVRDVKRIISKTGDITGSIKESADDMMKSMMEPFDKITEMFTQVSSIPARVMNGIGSAFGKAMDVFQTFGIMALIGVIAIGALLYGMRKEVFGFFKGKNMIIVTLALLILALGVISIIIPPLGDEWVLGVIGILGLVVA